MYRFTAILLEVAVNGEHPMTNGDCTGFPLCHGDEVHVRPNLSHNMSCLLIHTLSKLLDANVTESFLSMFFARKRI